MKLAWTSLTVNFRYWASRSAGPWDPYVHEKSRQLVRAHSHVADKKHNGVHNVSFVIQENVQRIAENYLAIDAPGP